MTFLSQEVMAMRAPAVGAVPLFVGVRHKEMTLHLKVLGKKQELYHYMNSFDIQTIRWIPGKQFSMKTSSKEMQMRDHATRPQKPSKFCFSSANVLREFRKTFAKEFR